MNDDVNREGAESQPSTDAIEQVQDRAPMRPTKAKIQSAYSLPISRPEVLSKILQAYVIASKQGVEAIKYTDVAAVAGVHPTVVSGNNSFLAESGFIVSARYGYYKPSPETIEFAKQAPWDEEGAKKFVRAQIDRAWFGETVRQQFQMFDTLTKEQQIRAFGLKSVADESDKNKLGFLFDFLVYFEYVIPDENGNYTLRQDETSERTEGVHPIDDMISDDMKGQNPSNAVDKFIGRFPARSRPDRSATRVNVNINITPSTTDDELDSLVKKAKFVIDSLSRDNS